MFTGTTEFLLLHMQHIQPSSPHPPLPFFRQVRFGSSSVEIPYVPSSSFSSFNAKPKPSPSHGKYARGISTTASEQLKEDGERRRNTEISQCGRKDGARVLMGNLAWMQGRDDPCYLPGTSSSSVKKENYGLRSRIYCSHSSSGCSYKKFAARSSFLSQAKKAWMTCSLGNPNSHNCKC